MNVRIRLLIYYLGQSLHYDSIYRNTYTLLVTRTRSVHGNSVHIEAGAVDSFARSLADVRRLLQHRYI